MVAHTHKQTRSIGEPTIYASTIHIGANIYIYDSPLAAISVFI